MKPLSDIRAVIRPMDEADLPEVAAIEKATFPNPWPARSLRYELTENEYCHSFAIEEDGAVVGYGFLWIIFEQAHLVNIAIRESHRGRGIGERLLVHLLRYAELNGAEFIHLEVRVTNEAAIKLYEKHGFRALGRSANFYSGGTDALLMVMELPSPGRRRPDGRG